MKWLPLQICSPLQVEVINRLVKEKKNLIRELRYRGEEKHGEKREQRQRERSMGRGETRVNDSKGVKREKAKGREKKWKNLPWEREKTPKNYVSHDYRRR